VVEIKNSSGEVVFVYPKYGTLYFDEADMSHVNLKGAILEGASFGDANLKRFFLQDLILPSMK
jgi:hypothetical protein